MNSASDLNGSRESLTEELLRSFSKTKLARDGSLKKRKVAYSDFFASQYHGFRSRMARRALISTNAEEIVSKHADWMDAWISFTWKFVLEEETLLMKEVLRLSDQKISFFKKTLPEKIKRKTDIEQFIAVEKKKPGYIDYTISYYQNTLKEVDREISALELELEVLQEIIPQISSAPSNEDKLLQILLIFSRGSYGRRELSFSSDIDIGFCLDISGLSKLEFQTVQELIKRMEELFQTIPLDVASQYFELGENLSRFGAIDKLHTIPSILEGHKIIGNEQNLKELKKQLLKICPREKIIHYLKQQLDELATGKKKAFYIKEGFGGVRHLQLALWMELVVDGHKSGNTRFLLNQLRKKGWISFNDTIDLLSGLEFYLDLRNFLGLYEFYREELKKLGLSELVNREKSKLDVLDDRDRLAYLKLKERFATIDYMDRFHLYSINKVETMVRSIVKSALNQIVIKHLSGFVLYKHLGTNQIVKIESSQIYSKAQDGRVDSDSEKEFFNLFINPENIFLLFQYIAQTGTRLAKNLENHFSLLLPQLYEKFTPKSYPTICDFIFDLFKAENASVAVDQMMEISAPLKYNGEIKTLLGLFFPEANKMRFLVRNQEIHKFPLCVHSLKALQQVEKEIDIIKKEEPELWLYIKEDDIFALKWSALFHDIGKIDPYKTHEKLGAELSTKMLLRLGWDQDSKTLTLIRFLISNHQAAVRYSRLATYPDLAIIKFFELAHRNPAEVILLYLINLSDFKSVAPELEQKAGPLERFFQKTVSIMEEFKSEQSPGSIKETVNKYLDRQVDETGLLVLIELLVRQSLNKSLEETIIDPLKKLAPEEAQNLEKYYKELERSIAFLKLGELDADSLAKHGRRVRLIIKQAVSKKNIFSIASPLAKSWDWFFKALPNRYLLSSKVDLLAPQLQRFENRLSQKARFSFVPGDVGEYDSLVFHCARDLKFQSTIAYVMSMKGFNIEGGKINKILYSDTTEDMAGFFTLSRNKGAGELSNIELQSIVSNMISPPLKPIYNTKKSDIKIESFEENRKGYLVTEEGENKFSRIQKNFVGIKISLKDAPFCFYKILRAFEETGVAPQQITITTIGDQIIDYFYIPPEEKKKLIGDDFRNLLQSYIDGEINLS